MRRTTKILFFLFLILLILGGFFGFGENVCWAEENDLIITEIMYNTAGSDTGKEWVEIFNNTGENILMEKWTLEIRGSSGSNTYAFPIFELQKNSFAVVHLRVIGTNSITDLYQNSTSGSNLGDSRGSVSLYDVNNKIIDFIEYGAGGQTFETKAVDATIWTKDDFISSIREAYTLEVVNGLKSNNKSTDWQESYVIGGTPGRENSKKSKDEPEDEITTPLCKDSIILSEIYPFSNEFVEVENIGVEACDLVGWKISDEKNKPKIFPTNSVVYPGKKFSFVKNFGLNSARGDTARLFNPTGTDPIESISYEKPQKDYSFSKKVTGKWQWTPFVTRDEENDFEKELKKLKAAIVKIKANPKGKDTDKNNGEEIYLKNNSKKKINLKTWSIATGSKTLYNHPITKDFIIQPGKTKKITRQYSLFTLNNKKGAIELRYPNGEVASRVKYDKKKESVKDDEVYELAGKNWQWTAPAEETSIAKDVLQNNPSPSEENPEDIDQEIELNISEEEIALNLGKFSSLENKLALAEINFTPAGEIPCQSRENPGIILGAFSARDKIHQPVEIKPVNSWQKTLRKSNQFFNLLINQVVSLI